MVLTSLWTREILYCWAIKVDIKSTSPKRNHSWSHFPLFIFQSLGTQGTAFKKSYSVKCVNALRGHENNIQILILCNIFWSNQFFANFWVGAKQWCCFTGCRTFFNIIPISLWQGNYKIKLYSYLNISKRKYAKAKYFVKCYYKSMVHTILIQRGCTTPH